MRSNNYGFHYSVGSGNLSFATQYFSNIRIALPGATASVAYGFYLGTDADIYRSTFNGMTIFPSIDNAVGFYCDGRMRNSIGSINIENNDATKTGVTGFEFDTNADLLNLNINADIRGTFANKIITTATTPISGLVTGSLSNAEAEIINAGVLTAVSSVVDDDLTTYRMIQKVTVNGNYQWQTNASTPPEFVDISTGNLSPVRMLNVGNPEATAANGDTTPSVADVTRLKVQQTTAATSITDFDDGVDGQQITIRFIQSTYATTIKNNVNIVLNGGTDFTPANNHSTLTLMCYGGTVWREIGRMES
jgi:hypothetical protein